MRLVKRRSMDYRLDAAHRAGDSPALDDGPHHVVCGEALRSSPTTGRLCARRVRTSASPRWPVLPVTRMVMDAVRPIAELLTGRSAQG
jgi:hypothetical protein